MPQFSDKQRFNEHLKKAKGLGSSHHGLDHWINQKVTAIVNAPLVVWLVYSIVSLKGASHAEFTTWLAHPLNAILLIILTISVFYHARLGTQVVVEDYIAEGFFKRMKLTLLPVVFGSLAVALIFSILKIAFTAGV